MSAARSWLRPRYRTIAAMALLLIAGWSVYSYWTDYRVRTALQSRETLSPRRGAACVVVLRRDSAGDPSAADSRGPHEALGPTVRGAFVNSNDRWVVLSNTDADQPPEIWIPREQILLMKIGTR
ncbi:MAG: hypothetical protein KDA61_07715 [Planctomycetales bacterium]|nr:hypothetical protein [Planctomycetales bacterium]